MDWNMKKGQAEMLGLVVIVILLIISFFLYVSLKGDEEGSRMVRSSIRANNVLNAVLLVDVEGEQMKELLKRCVVSGDESSGECVDVKGELKNILDKIILNQNYKFTIFKKDGSEFFPVEEGSCENPITASSARFPGDYRYEFELCYT